MSYHGTNDPWRGAFAVDAEYDEDDDAAETEAEGLLLSLDGFVPGDDTVIGSHVVRSLFGDD